VRVAGSPPSFCAGSVPGRLEKIGAALPSSDFSSVSSFSVSLSKRAADPYGYHMQPKKLTTTLTAALTVAALARSALAGPVEDAVVEYSRGDYATALRFFRPIAEQGDARAQFVLASMYL
jgi:TPR repeat protein